MIKYILTVEVTVPNGYLKKYLVDSVNAAFININVGRYGLKRIKVKVKEDYYAKKHTGVGTQETKRKQEQLGLELEAP